MNKFEKPNTSPNSIQPSTTVLSPYVMFGCLSARLFYHRLSDVYSRVSYLRVLKQVEQINNFYVYYKAFDNVICLIKVMPVQKKSSAIKVHLTPKSFFC